MGADGEEMGVLDEKVGFRENGEEESKRVDVVVVGVEAAEKCGWWWCCCCCCCSVVEMGWLMAIGEGADGLPLTCCI